MTYSYSSPLTYGPNEPLHYEGMRYNKTTNASAVMGGLVIGGAAGGFIGSRKNHCFTETGEVLDSFAQTTYENVGNNKEAYNNSKKLLKEIDDVKTVDELKKLFENNKEATTEFCEELKQSSEEFLNRVTNDNLNENKKVIKERFETSNKTRIQDMKNQIQSCWDKDKKKFIKNENVTEDVFKKIKELANASKWRRIGKFALIGAGITGFLTFFVSKYLNK